MTASAALRRALHPRQLRQSLLVMLIVGTILNLINQGDAIWAGGELDLLRAGLTYVVPFCVSTYGAWSALRQGSALACLTSILERPSEVRASCGASKIGLVFDEFHIGHNDF